MKKFYTSVCLYLGIFICINLGLAGNFSNAKAGSFSLSSSRELNPGGFNRGLAIKNFNASSFLAASGTWGPVTYSSSGITPTSRHENGFVEVNGKFYLVGGRTVRNVNIFDPVSRIWSLGAASPVELNHFQAVVYNNEIYAICAMSGTYPNEKPLANIYIYNTQTNTWRTGAAIPLARRRGSAGVVVYNSKFYVVGGIQNGHIDGWVNWVDEYNPSTGSWTILPNAPVARDHFMATLINGKIYAAGGRQTHYPDYAANTVARVDVYDIAAKVWTTPTQIPTPRGAPGVAYIDGELIVAGGEVSGSGSALKTVEGYNVATNTWQVKPGLDVGRHATQMISYQGKLYLCAGSTTRGGSGQTNTMSVADYTSDPAVPETAVVRINAGGAAVQFGSELWKADQYFSGGSTFSSTIAISNTTNDALYQSERKGNMTYNIPVPQSGQYMVDLHFAELYFSTSGSRVFNVSVENGQFALQNIDLYKSYGKASAAVIKASNVQVSDGLLTITLTSVVNNAKISGIAVFLQSGTGTNQAPVANAGPDKTITLPTSSVVLSGSGSDPEDGTNVTYSWSQVSGPSTAAFSSATQASPTVSNLVAGTYFFALTVMDSKLLSSAPDQVSVIVNQNQANLPPIITKPPNANLIKDQFFSYQVIANDPEGTALNYAANNLPPSLSINSNTGLISGTVTASKGSYTVTLTVKDQAGLSASTSFSIKVNNPNKPHTVATPESTSLLAGQDFSYQVIADDPDRTPLKYKATNLPAGLVINTNSGLISGIVNDRAGSYAVTLDVRDPQGLTVRARFFIKVINENQAPEINNPASQTVFLNMPFKYQVAANDPEDGKTGLIYAANRLPAGLSINSQTGLISGSITGSVGQYRVLLNVQDKEGLAAVGKSFILHVKNGNAALSINKLGGQAVMTSGPVPVYESTTADNSIPAFKTKVFPNPAHREFSVTFSIKQRSEWRFTLYSSNGSMIQLPRAWFDKGISTVNFNLNSYNLVPGIYFLIMTNDMNERETSKIIIN